ncbi:hypothetical protein Mapa_008657 [Marchantia paleacea]|nr:hypothetical protein Mapa_008657 [Marchantia paleacea]
MSFCRSSAQLFKSTNRPTLEKGWDSPTLAAKVAVLKRDDDRPPSSAIADGGREDEKGSVVKNRAPTLFKPSSFSSLPPFLLFGRQR